MEQELLAGGYQLNKDFHVFSRDSLGYTVSQLRQNRKILVSRHKLKHHRRYIIIADRRHTDKGQRYNNDKLYLIIPKEWDGGRIHVKYEPYLNECFFASTMQFLFPLPGLDG